MQDKATNFQNLKSGILKFRANTEFAPFGFLTHSNKRINSIFEIISCAFFALGFCSPIYFFTLLDSLDSQMPLALGSILAILAIYTYLRIPAKRRFYTGFFISLFWFYWVGFGSRFIGLDSEISIFLMFLLPILTSIIWGAIFWVLLFCECLLVRLLGLLILGFLAPFSFNWLQPSSLLAYSYFGVYEIHLCFLVLAIFCVAPKKQNELYQGKKWLIFGVIFFLLSLDFGTAGNEPFAFVLFLLCVLLLALKNFDFFDFLLKERLGQYAFAVIIFSVVLSAFAKPNIPEFASKIQLAQTSINQGEKWGDVDSVNVAILENFELIESAIKAKKKLIVLPEMAFALNLNSEEILLQKLKDYSHKIDILTGALNVQKNAHSLEFFNAAYFFQNGEVIIANKVILAPFGEFLPLPDFVKNFAAQFLPVQDMEFDKAAHFTDIKARFSESSDKNGADSKNFANFRVAICYEATHKSAFDGFPRNVLVISNNAWFVPSIEPYLQKMLLKFYARKYDAIIFHASNMSNSAIITP